jgi:4a-hydroxytetrahydrobiopterin dehydratase
MSTNPSTNTAAEELRHKKCLPCEGGVAPLSHDQACVLTRATPDWTISTDEKWISRSIRFKNFAEMMKAVVKIADLSEAEAHHPDLHLTGYRHLRIELTTHAIGGLSENDFVLAAKIDLLLATLPS